MNLTQTEGTLRVHIRQRAASMTSNGTPAKMNESELPEAGSTIREGILEYNRIDGAHGAGDDVVCASLILSVLRPRWLNCRPGG